MGETSRKVIVGLSASTKLGSLNGKYERYNESGALVEKGQFVDGEKEGKWVWYDGGHEV